MIFKLVFQIIVHASSWSNLLGSLPLIASNNIRIEVDLGRPGGAILSVEEKREGLGKIRI